MTTTLPANPKIYHILHLNRLPSIINDKQLWCDADMNCHPASGTTIGMTKIKQRRLTELRLACHPDLFVGQCVPFYFCPRSVMLYLLHKGNNQELNYTDGQKPIIHLEAELYEVIAWANKHNKRWAFTASNAGAYFTKHLNNLDQLATIDWGAIASYSWQDKKEQKQAEFLLEKSLPWHLIQKIGVYSSTEQMQVNAMLDGTKHLPNLVVSPNWYY